MSIIQSILKIQLYFKGGCISQLKMFIPCQRVGGFKKLICERQENYSVFKTPNSSWGGGESWRFRAIFSEWHSLLISQWPQEEAKGAMTSRGQGDWGWWPARAWALAPTTLISSLSNHWSLSSDLDHMSGRKAVFRRVTHRRDSTSPGDPAVLVLSLTWKFTHVQAQVSQHTCSQASRQLLPRALPPQRSTSSPVWLNLASTQLSLLPLGTLPPPSQWVSGDLHSFVWLIHQLGLPGHAQHAAAHRKGSVEEFRRLFSVLGDPQ